MRINQARPLERLRGHNLSSVRNILGRIHVSRSLLYAARAARPKNMGAVPVALRRGWVLAVIETWTDNRRLFAEVMRGHIGRYSDLELEDRTNELMGRANVGS